MFPTASQSGNAANKLQFITLKSNSSGKHKSRRVTDDDEQEDEIVDIPDDVQKDGVDQNGNVADEAGAGKSDNAGHADDVSTITNESSSEENSVTRKEENF